MREAISRLEVSRGDTHDHVAVLLCTVLTASLRTEAVGTQGGREEVGTRHGRDECLPVGPHVRRAVQGRGDG